ncbi:MAG: DNA-directed RNA polymerase subunit omega [candidate division NC10 bacterium RIFCSPLOWO2_12_FULL_66_18]|nr:MAG: DNA-directed RNA polymerase subunit omega [candidate division NC10 bacterium RIFCSPLOWO2_12_FULL_66_18]
MSQVPFEDLMEHIDSKYRLVIVAAKRAKQLNRGAVPLIQPRTQKPTYQALEEVAAGKLGYEIEALAGETTRELTEAEGKPTWFRSLSAEEVVPEEAVAEAEERLEEEEAAVEAPVAGAPAEDLIINEIEEESLEELGEIDVIEREEGEE